MKKILQRQLSGFSLIEAAFFLLIVGIAASLTFPFLTTFQNMERHKVTESNQRQIFQVLAGYALTHYKLPPPSTPELAGKKEASYVKNGKIACVGILPYQELGLPESIAKDGYGHWFTYAVTRQLVNEYGRNDDNVAKKKTPIVNNKALQAGYFCETFTSGLNVISSAGDSVFNITDKKDMIAVVLVSHGPKGTGAFHPILNERLPVENPFEQTNAIDDETFVTQTNQNINTGFNHKTYWVTRNNLMAIYGKRPCQSFTKGKTDVAKLVEPSEPPSKPLSKILPKKFLFFKENGKEMISAIPHQKQHLRQQMRQLRQKAHYTADQSQVAQQLINRFFSLNLLEKGIIIAGYWAYGSEISVLPLMQKLHSDDYTVVLPAVKTPESPLFFRRWQPEFPLQQDGMGIPCPGHDQPILSPTVLLVPLLAFDVTGARLGQGIGFYDKTIRQLRSKHVITTVGVAYEMQKIDTVPISSKDEKLDYIITEQATYHV